MGRKHAEIERYRYARGGLVPAQRLPPRPPPGGASCPPGVNRPRMRLTKAEPVRASEPASASPSNGQVRQALGF